MRASARRRPGVAAALCVVALLTALSGSAYAFWGAASTVVSGTGIGLNATSDRQVAVDGTYVHAVYRDASGNIQYTRSADGGATWSQPSAWTSLTSSKAGQAPSIAAANGSVFISFIRPGTGNASVQVWRATANGGTWVTAPTQLRGANANVDQTWSAAVAVNDAGTVRANVLWRDGNGIRSRATANGGTSWNGAVTALAAANAAAGYGRVSMAAPQGVALLWKPSATAGVITASTNQGTSWGAAVALPTTAAYQSVYATATASAVTAWRVYGDGTGVSAQRFTAGAWGAATRMSDAADDGKALSSVGVTGDGTRLLAVWSYAAAASTAMTSRQSADAGSTWGPVKRLPAAAGGWLVNVEGAPTVDHLLYSAAASPAAIYHLGWTVDLVAPSVPANLSVSGTTSSTVGLTWTASADASPSSGIGYYRIYRGGSLVGSATATSYTAAGLTPSTGYTFQVDAVDNDGNASARSASVAATTAAPGPVFSMTMLTTSTVNFGVVNVGSAYTAAIKPQIQVVSNRPWDYSSTTTSVTAGAASFPFDRFVRDTGTVAFGVGLPAGTSVDTRTIVFDLSGNAAYDIPANTPVQTTVMYTAVQQP